MDVLSRGDATPSSALISGAYTLYSLYFREDRVGSFNRSPVPWLLARPLAGFEWRAAIAPHATLRLSHSFSLVPCAHSLCRVRERSVSFYLYFPLSRSRSSRSLAHTLFLLLFLSWRCSRRRATRRGFIRSVYPAACVRERWRTTCASAKNVHTYWCYLRGGKSTPRECNFRAEEEEARVPAAPCRKIQGVCNYLAHRIRAHRKDPPCTKLSPRLRTRGTFLTPMRRLSRPSH